MICINNIIFVVPHLMSNRNRQKYKISLYRHHVELTVANISNQWSLRRMMRMNNIPYEYLIKIFDTYASDELIYLLFNYFELHNLLFDIKYDHKNIFKNPKIVQYVVGYSFNRDTRIHFNACTTYIHNATFICHMELLVWLLNLILHHNNVFDIHYICDTVFELACYYYELCIVKHIISLNPCRYNALYERSTLYPEIIN